MGGPDQDAYGIGYAQWWPYLGLRAGLVDEHLVVPHSSWWGSRGIRATFGAFGAASAAPTTVKSAIEQALEVSKSLSETEKKIDSVLDGLPPEQLEAIHGHLRERDRILGASHRDIVKYLDENGTAIARELKALGISNTRGARIFSLLNDREGLLVEKIKNQGEEDHLNEVLSGLLELVPRGPRFELNSLVSRRDGLLGQQRYGATNSAESAESAQLVENIDREIERIFTDAGMITDMGSAWARLMARRGALMEYWASTREASKRIEAQIASLVPDIPKEDLEKLISLVRQRDEIVKSEPAFWVELGQNQDLMQIMLGPQLPGPDRQRIIDLVSRRDQLVPFTARVEEMGRLYRSGGPYPGMERAHPLDTGSIISVSGHSGIRGARPWFGAGGGGGGGSPLVPERGRFKGLGVEYEGNQYGAVVLGIAALFVVLKISTM